MCNFVKFKSLQETLYNSIVFLSIVCIIILDNSFTIILNYLKYRKWRWLTLKKKIYKGGVAYGKEINGNGRRDCG